MPGKYLEMMYIFMAFVFQSHHSFLDPRYVGRCVVGKHSIILRDPFVPDACDDSVECYVSMTLLSAFVLPPRLRYLAIFVLPWLPTPFLLRTTVFGLDHFLRMSDGVWFFMCLVYIISFVANEFVYRRQFIQHELVQSEIEEAKHAQRVVRRLLDAMLPVSVLKRLIANETVADCGEVSMVFSDVAGFTSWCSAQKPEDVVRMLNTMYNLFDNGLPSHEIEKIKTIGDAYWAVCGLPDPNSNHILHVCGFANYMLHCMKQMGEDNPHHSLQIRIGVHTGQVCGGLVGKQQCTYDMFGTSNEVAEMMEQRAPVGGILLSEPAYRELKNAFSFASGVDSMDETTFSVRLQDPAVETVQGTMASFVLKTFSWTPPLLQRKDTNSSTTETSLFTTSTASTPVAKVTEQRTETKFAMLFKHEFSQNSSISSKMTFGDTLGTKSITSADEMKALEDQQQELFKASGCHHTFDDPKVEAQFQPLCARCFPIRCRL